MTFPVKEAIRKRKSVRSYDGNRLSETDSAALEAYFRELKNPFGVPVDFRLLDARTYGLTSPVLVGAETYLAAKTIRAEKFELGYGYSFEAVCLYAASRGLGTVILAASLNRPVFEKVMDVQPDEVMPVVSPVGCPAAKRSIRETLMRKGLKADERLPFETLFFDSSFGAGLRPERAGAFAVALEMARWAPSAANRQPLRAVVDRNAVHFFEARSMKESPLGDIQKVDVGIALAHFDLTLREEGRTGRFVTAEPGLERPADVEYIVSFELAE